MYHVSIIMPVYNVSAYLPRAIESALNQKEVSFELILVNDGSTDHSEDICEAYAKEEPLLIKVIHQENQGSGIARQAGVKEASGEYIYFADPDDYFDATLLKDNVKHAKKREAEVVVFGFTQEDASGENRQVKLPNLPQMDSREDLHRHFRNVYHFYPYALWNKLYKKEFLIKNNIRFGNQKQGQDALFNIEVYKYLSTVAVNRQAYYHYVAHKALADKSYNTEEFKFNLEVARAIEKLFKLWEEDFSDLISEEYFRTINLEITNLIRVDCPLTQQEKIELLKLYSKQLKNKLWETKIDAKNPFHQAILYAIKKDRLKTALKIKQAEVKMTKKVDKIQKFKNN